MLQVAALNEKLPDFRARPEEELFELLRQISEYLDVTCTCMLCSVGTTAQEHDCLCTWGKF